MTTKIDQKAVTNLKTNEVISDTEVAGFRARRWKSGHVTFDFRYRTKSGQRRSVPIGKYGNLTTAQARLLAKKYAWEVANGQDPAAEKRTAEESAGKTVAAVWDEYAKRELPKLRSGAERQRDFDRLVRQAIGDRSIYEIRRSDMTKLLDTIADNNGPVQADRMMAYLSACFHWQQVRDDDFVSPIVSGMNRTTAKERARDRTLSDNEIRSIWKATEGHAGVTFHALIRFLLLTGARRSEAAEMTFSELDGSTWILPAARNKTKAELVRPLSADAMAILKAFDRSNGYVFVMRGDKPITHFTDLKQKLDNDSGVADWTIHDLRRTAASLMPRAGVPAEHVERCLGHVIGGVKGVYNRHAYYEEKRDAFEKLAALIRTITR